MSFIKLTPTAGLYYTNTYSAWDLSSALTERSTLIDGVKNVGSVTGLWYTAIGIDLGSSHKVTKLIFYDWDTAGSGLWLPTFHATSIYKSDNGTSWTLVETISEAHRCAGGVDDIGSIEIVLTDPTTARYFCRYYSDPLQTSTGNIIGASEIEAFKEIMSNPGGNMNWAHTRGRQ